MPLRIQQIFSIKPKTKNFFHSLNKLSIFFFPRKFFKVSHWENQLNLLRIINASFECHWAYLCVYINLYVSSFSIKSNIEDEQHRATNDMSTCITFHMSFIDFLPPHTKLFSFSNTHIRMMTPTDGYKKKQTLFHVSREKLYDTKNFCHWNLFAFGGVWHVYRNEGGEKSIRLLRSGGEYW